MPPEPPRAPPPAQPDATRRPAPAPDALATPTPLAPVDPREAEAFVLTLAGALHEHGASAHRLEGMLTLVARRLGLDARFFSTPTAVMVAFGPPEAQRTALLRVQPGGIALEKLSLLQATVVDVHRGALDMQGGLDRVRAIVAAPPRYGRCVTVAAFGLSAIAMAVFLGGSAREIAAAAAVGIAVGATTRLAARVSTGASVVEPLGGFVAALGASLIARAVGGLSTMLVALAGVIVLLPGLGITTAMTELATRNLASGTARFAGAAIQLLGVAVGVAVGARVGALLGAFPPPPPTAWPAPVVAAALVAAGGSFTVLLGADPRDFGWIVLGSAVAFVGGAGGTHLFGPELGAFAGALALGLAGNTFAKVLDRPSAIVLVPGLIVLVPGSLGFRGLLAMLQADVVHGVDAAFRMTLTATAIGAGILLAGLILPPRRAL